jgi:hypothetical protein
MSSCEGCEPAESNLQKPPVVVFRNGEPPYLNPAAPPGPPAPPGTAPKVSEEMRELKNQVNALRFDLSVLVHAVMSRGLLTEKELLDAKMQVSVETQKAFEQMRKQLGRRFAQAPSAYPPKPPQNPRRSPQ